MTYGFLKGVKPVSNDTGHYAIRVMDFSELSLSNQCVCSVYGLTSEECLERASKIIALLNDYDANFDNKYYSKAIKLQ